MSREFCNELDNKLIKPCYSYCYHKSLKNFNKGDLKENIEKTILNNDNIHILGVHDGLQMQNIC